MLPILPFLIGGAVGTVVGVALKKLYDDVTNEMMAIVINLIISN